MKFLIVFICVFAICLANEEAKVIRNDADVQVDSFKYALELDNHVKSEQQGNLKDKDTWVVNGLYEFVSPEGEHVKLSYVADENGYQPESSLLPTPPPIPPEILKAIAYIEAHPSKEDSKH